MIEKVYSLLSQVDRHPKMIKSLNRGVLTGIMHLAPADLSGREVCPMRSAGCTAACLNTAGTQWPGRNDKQAARIRRTKMFFDRRQEFMDKLANEIRRQRNYALEHDFIFGVRLNGTSDIPWEKVAVRQSMPIKAVETLLEMYPDVKFYDYTKRPNRRDLPANYRLTFSRSENNEDDCLQAAENGMNIAVVFNVEKDQLLPPFWTIWGSDPMKSRAFPVIDGDEHDFRFADYDEYPGRVIVGLRAKGKAKIDTTGFVIQVGEKNGQ